jgi:SAM-dependent methyltransferase
MIAKIKPFETHAEEYDAWYDLHPYVFESEVEAIRNMLPYGESRGIEVGLGTGRFSTALGLKEGVEPSFAMRRIALGRGVEVMDAVAEKLPYKDMNFDFVLMASCVSYFYNMQDAFLEANRVLKRGGVLIIGFIKKDSIIGRSYEEKRQKSIFYKDATFYSSDKIETELKNAGFKHLEFSQTLFEGLEDINEFEPSKPGFDEGSFVVIKAVKK